MNEQISALIPADLVNFLFVVAFSLLIGLEQRKLFPPTETDERIGTDRAFTLLGVLGFSLYVIDKVSLIPFLVGGIIIGALFTVFYYHKLSAQHSFSISSIIAGLCTYCSAPLIYTQHHWLVILILVIILVVVDSRNTLAGFANKMGSDEFYTLAKFLIMSGIILPLLPDKPISATIDISPYKFWLAIVAISGISYFSYLLKKYFFPQSGIVLTGILGGLYSSTATTFILAKKSKELQEDNKIMAGIILATSMMYIRIFLLSLMFNRVIALKILPVFVVLLLVSLLIAYYFYRKDGQKQDTDQLTQPLEANYENPLELKTAMVFGLLFVIFSVVTTYVTNHYGAQGIKILSFMVGVTDIDPFIINVFQSKWSLPVEVLAVAVINAVTSNNILKMLYAITLSKKSLRIPILFAFGIIIALGFLASFFYKF